MSDNKVESPAQEAPKVEIAPELLQQLQAIRALATAHNLLDKGLFSHEKAEAVRVSLDFLRSLHTQCVDTAIQHPQADLIPELASFKAKASEGAEDVESN